MTIQEVRIPIVLITFNRPHCVEKQLEQLRKMGINKLFFVSDGPRINVEGERALVEKTRALIDTIDWECEVIKIFATENMGVDARVISALNLVFGQAEQAIILEDDCLPCSSFFKYCDELLERYQDEEKIMYISGSKWIHDYPMKYSYGFSYNTGTWGWATWKRAWNSWHWDIEEWKKNKNNWMKGIFSSRYCYNWAKDLDQHLKNGNLPWDYAFISGVGKRLGIFPAVNMVTHIGFGEDATHAKEEIYGYDGTTTEMGSIVHPEKIEEDLDYPKAVEKQFKVPYWYRVKRKLIKILKRG